MTIATKAKLIGGSVATLLIIIAIVIVVVYFKKKGNITALPKETEWGKQLTEDESQTVYRIATALYDDMDGLSFGVHDPKIYQEYAACSDRIFIAVANYFLQKWGRGENLATWIKDETYGTALTATINSILSRLATFGILPIA